MGDAGTMKLVANPALSVGRRESVRHEFAFEGEQDNRVVPVGGSPRDDSLDPEQ
mgnify:CR=1 FL=1